jgi:hypothetical protein
VIVLRRVAFRPKNPPPMRAARQWTGDALPGSRTPPARVADDSARMVVPLPKAAPLRSESYRRFVASQACFGCGVEGFSQAAHPNQGKGMAFKTSDALCFPLCGPHFGLLGCHQAHDLRLDMGRDASRAIEAAYTARMQRIARAAGRKEFA